MEQTEDGEQVEGVRKRLKRMEYTIIGEDWGEEKDLEDGDGDKDGGVYVSTTITPPVPSTRGTKPTSITDYFPSLRRRKLQQGLGLTLRGYSVGG